MRAFAGREMVVLERASGQRWVLTLDECNELLDGDCRKQLENAAIEATITCESGFTVEEINKLEKVTRLQAEIRKGLDQLKEEEE